MVATIVAKAFQNDSFVAVHHRSLLLSSSLHCLFASQLITNSHFDRLSIASKN
jgi:hypothetical protein